MDRRKSNQQLFLFEILIKKVTLINKEDSANALLQITIKFMDLSPLDIKQENLHVEDSQEKEDGVFSGGKSCLFPSTTPVLVNSLKTRPLEITVYRKDKQTGVLDVVGETSVSVANAIREGNQQLDDNILDEITVYDSYPLTSPTSKVAGTITMFIRLSCFGATIISPIQQNSEKAEEGKENKYETDTQTVDLVSPKSDGDVVNFSVSKCIEPSTIDYGEREYHSKGSSGDKPLSSHDYSEREYCRRFSADRPLSSNFSASMLPSGGRREVVAACIRDSMQKNWPEYPDLQGSISEGRGVNFESLAERNRSVMESGQTPYFCSDESVFHRSAAPRGKDFHLPPINWFRSQIPNSRSLQFPNVPVSSSMTSGYPSHQTTSTRGQCHLECMSDTLTSPTFKSIGALSSDVRNPPIRYDTTGALSPSAGGLFQTGSLVQPHCSARFVSTGALSSSFPNPPVRYDTTGALSPAAGGRYHTGSLVQTHPSPRYDNTGALSSAFQNPPVRYDTTGALSPAYEAFAKNEPSDHSEETFVKKTVNWHLHPSTKKTPSAKLACSGGSGDAGLGEDVTDDALLQYASEPIQIFEDTSHF